MKKISLEKISELKKTVRELPKRNKNYSGFDTVGLMKNDLKAALKRGYSYEELAQKLSSGGASISPRTLEKYHREHLNGGKRVVKKAAGKKAGDVPELVASATLEGVGPEPEPAPIDDDPVDMPEPVPIDDDPVEMPEPGRISTEVDRGADQKPETQLTEDVRGVDQESELELISLD